MDLCSASSCETRGAVGGGDPARHLHLRHLPVGKQLPVTSCAGTAGSSPSPRLSHRAGSAQMAARFGGGLSQSLDAFQREERPKVRRAEASLAFEHESLVPEMWWRNNMKSVQLQRSRSARNTLANVLSNVELSL